MRADRGDLAASLCASSSADVDSQYTSSTEADQQQQQPLNCASLDQLSASSSPVENWLNDEFNFSEQEFKERELFSSKQFSHVAAKNLRGHCFVSHFRDVKEALDFDPLPDHFFFILQYNPQNRSAPFGSSY